MENKQNTGNGARGVSLASAKKRQKRKNRENRFIAFCAVVVIILIAGWLMFDKLFIISEFSLEGNIEYSKEEAEVFAEKIGLEKGMHLFGFDKKELQTRAKYYIPEVDDVSIGYRFPDKVVFKVKESNPVMYLTESGKHFVLSEGLKVVNAFTDASDAEILSLIKVHIGGITKCQSGTFLETESGCDRILISLYNIFKEEGVLDDVTEIDLSNKFNISFQYKQRFTVILGNEENLTVKVRFMEKIASELAENDRGYIDVSDENFREGTFKSYS